MLGADALTALAEAESHLAQITDAIFRLDTGPAADFAGYVWFVLTAVEQLQQAPYAPDATAVVQRPLGFDQMDSALRVRWIAFASAVRRTYKRDRP